MLDFCSVMRHISPMFKMLLISIMDWFRLGRFIIALFLCVVMEFFFGYED